MHLKHHRLASRHLAVPLKQGFHPRPPHRPVAAQHASKHHIDTEDASVFFVLDGQDCHMAVEGSHLAQPAKPAASSSSDGGQNKQPGDDQEFRLNFGKAVRTLRQELPMVFEQALTHDIYHPNVRFESPWLELHSLSWYLWAQTCLRVVSRLLFSRAELQLATLWSPSPGVLRARCRLMASPWGSQLVLSVVQSLAALVKHALGKQREETSPPYNQAQWQLDLLFTYHFSSKGYVSRHVVQQVLPVDEVQPAAQAEAAPHWAPLRAGSPASRLPPH